MQFAHISTPSLSSYKVDISYLRFPSYIEIIPLSIFTLHTLLQICLYCLPNSEMSSWKWKKINHFSFKQTGGWLNCSALIQMLCYSNQPKTVCVCVFVCTCMSVMQYHYIFRFFFFGGGYTHLESALVLSVD